MAKVVSEFLLELFGRAWKFFALNLKKILRDSRQLWRDQRAGQPKAAGWSFLGLQHFVDISLQMVQALLLVHVGQLIGIVAFSAVGYHHSRVVSGNHLPGLLAPCVSVERLGSLLGRGRD